MAKVPDAAMMVLPFEPLWMRARRGSLSVGDPDLVLPRLTGGVWCGSPANGANVL